MSHLTHLRTFLEAWRSHSISRAAERLAITQPAASLHIQSLEALVGKPLFTRQARGVVPTEAADELARFVSPLIDGLESKLATYRQGEQKGGTLHIAGPSDFIHYRLADILAPLVDEGYFIRFHTGNKQRIYELLDAESVDVAITASLPDERVHGFAHLLTERMLLVCSPSLATKIGYPPTVESLTQLPLIAWDEELPLVRMLWLALFKVAPMLQAALTINDLRIIKDLVEAGQGWTVLPDYHCGDALAKGSLVAVTELAQAPTNELYLVWKKSAVNARRTVWIRERILQAFPR